MAKILSEKDVDKMRRNGKVSLKRIKPPAPEPDKMKQLLSNMEKIIKTSESMADANNKIMKYMFDKIVDIQPSVDVNPKQWEFSVQRDSKGFIKKVYAKAV